MVDKKPKSQHIKMSLRISNKVTSITIKKNIIVLWLIFSDKIDLEDLEDLDFEKVSVVINNFVYSCLNGWDKDTGKGLSEFITDMMIKDFLDDSYTYSVYRELLKGIKI